MSCCSARGSSSGWASVCVKGCTALELSLFVRLFGPLSLVLLSHVVGGLVRRPSDCGCGAVGVTVVPFLLALCLSFVQTCAVALWCVLRWGALRVGLPSPLPCSNSASVARYLASM
jgi:hypothetical protein